MIAQPFKILEPYADRVHIRMYTKEDTVDSDTASHALFGYDGASLHQVHGNKTEIITKAQGPEIQADGMLTTTPNLPLCIRWADCQNFIIYEPNHHIVGLLHAGWRGLVAGAIAEFFRTLQREYDVLPSDVLVGAGPSLCAACADFSNPREELPTIEASFIRGKCVDLQAVAEAEFLDLGVSPHHFERHPDCTRCNPLQYWTYRGGDRDCVKEGQVNRLSCVLL